MTRLYIVEYTSITLVPYFMLSNDYSMYAKMLMHPNSVFLHYFKRTTRRKLGVRRLEENQNYVNHEIEFVGSMAGTRATQPSHLTFVQ